MHMNIYMRVFITRNFVAFSEWRKMNHVMINGQEKTEFTFIVLTGKVLLVSHVVQHVKMV